MTAGTRAFADAVRLASEAAADVPAQVTARIRLHAAMRAAWLHRLWTDEAGLDDEPLTRIAEARDRPGEEAAWRADDPALAGLRGALAETDARLVADPSSRLGHLERVFGLESAERDLLHLCLAAAVDGGLAPILRHLAGDSAVAAPTGRLAARLFASPRPTFWRELAPVARWQLVVADSEDGVDGTLRLDDGLLDWLTGGPLADPVLKGRIQAVPPLEPLPGWPVKATAESAARLIEADPRTPVRISVTGVQGAGRATFAAAVVRRLDLSLFCVDLSGLTGAPRTLAVLHGHRQAYLARAAVAWRGAGSEPPALAADLVPFPVEFVLLGATEGARPGPRQAEIGVVLDAPDVDTRRALWKLHCPEAAAWPAEQLDLLAAQNRAVPGRIAAAAARRPRSAAEAGQFLRDPDGQRLGALARRLACPYRREDLVLPQRLSDQLDTLLYEARNRIAFWERPGARRLFPHGRGLIALFTGMPGTGKTMAAQVIARELGYDLYRIDLSSVISKYIGETAENIERILAEARQMDVVLLFDEADGLFARRTDVSDAHDRYANTDTGHLLQTIEDYDGIAILASNRKRNLDEAFLRRLRYVLDFPLPDDGGRLAIWRGVIVELAGADAATRLDPALSRLSTRVPLTGAQIKNAALTGLFASEREGEPLAPRHLLTGIDAELMKEGRALSTRELGALEAGA